MTPSILVVNTGSSSIKFCLYHCSDEGLHQLLRGMISGLGNQNSVLDYDENGIEESIALDEIAMHEQALTFLVDWLEKKVALSELIIAHRVVHGGNDYVKPVEVTPSVIEQLKKYIPMAPTHQEQSILAMEILKKDYPSVKQVACFDTAFHANHNKPVNQFAISNRYFDEGIRRYGFHGLSYESVADVIRDDFPDLYPGKLVIAHLGNGSSLCAVENGISIDSSMGFSTLEGLMMGQRCGSIDAGVVLFLLSEKGYSVSDVSELLYEQSGLLGVSGISNDVRHLINSDKDEAKEAIELFIYRIVKEIGSLLAVLRGVDGIIFTGGIGENQPLIRQKICDAYAWLGLEINHDANIASETIISTEQSPVKVLVIPCNEERVIAKHTLNMVN